MTTDEQAAAASSSHSATQKSMRPNIWFGHSHNGVRKDAVPELLRDHTNEVAAKAAQFGALFGCVDQARATAILHDLGKYSPQFQRRLFDPREKGRDHWAIGAMLAAKLGKRFGELPALCIEGHHVGLGLCESHGDFIKRVSQQMSENPDRFTTVDGKAVLDAFRADGFELPKFNSGFVNRHDYVGDMLDTRMLFSTLVDSDFLETEAHFSGDKSFPRRPRPVGQILDVNAAFDAFDRYVAQLNLASEFQKQNFEASKFISLRQNLLQSCRSQGASLSTGLFTLSAPTGAGKTLAMLGFALEHARMHGLRRIVLVMPFLNIVDQTARVYRQIFSRDQFGDDFVLECHSLADGATEKLFADECSDFTQDDIHPIRRRRQLLSENWDAPIVLTTSVQLLESLFAHKPSRCRKLHRLAGSVILFDEVQTLPPKLVVATLGTLNRMAGSESPFRTSVVFATATQPAFESLSPRLATLVDEKRYSGKNLSWKPQELVTNANELYATAASRVSIDWRHDKRIEFAKLADELARHGQTLAIVNLKRHAIELAESLRSKVGDTLHLSTNMCSEHRLKVLDHVKQRLEAKRPVRLVATQCIEAGVDIDFPCVYRALAPLEAIAQAAGRCNRSGLRETGIVTVFKPLDLKNDGRERNLYPPGYSAAVAATESFLNMLLFQLAPGETLPEIINSPELLRKYYELLYAQHGRDTAEHADERELHEAIRAGNFPDVAKHYRLIEQNVISVLVPYDAVTYQMLVAEANTDDMTPKQVRAWIRKARPQSVAVYRPASANSEIWNHLIPLPLGTDSSDESDGGISTDSHDWWRPANEKESYDDFVGLKFAETQWIV
ncbi:MAG: CRISPR-associated endonuclease Cas3'' [Pirellulaceae bacterium]|nr:CRISPR-associated endonuclease Cas3'' [Pirellulaceae bacterium]